MGPPGVTGCVASRSCCVLTRTRRYDDITNVDKLTGVQTQVNQVKEVMQQNVDQMLQTHEKLEDLETKAGARAYSHRRTRARADTHGRMNARARKTLEDVRPKPARPLPPAAPPCTKARSVCSTAYCRARTNGIAKG